MWHSRTADRTLGPAVYRGPDSRSFTLAEAVARDPLVAGNKAAALATAAVAGLPVVPGVVLPVDRQDAGESLRAVWDQVSRHGEQAVAVRSSSTLEDTEGQSMAGQFTTVLEITSYPDFVDAVAEVRASAGPAPMAVLVQPMLRPGLSGVLFGRDPVTGADHLVVEVVRGTAEQLVGGRVSATRHVLGHRGRLLEAERAEGAIDLPASLRRGLAELARRAASCFDGPQDIEWAHADGRLWLLQSRPITRVAAPVPRGPVFGPGPIAETFPDPLSPLEADLWVPPLRAGLRAALVLGGVAARRRVDRSPVLITIEGRVAADLSLIDPPAVPRWRSLLDPRNGLRQLRRVVDPRTAPDRPAVAGRHRGRARRW